MEYICVHCIALHCFALHCIALHCIALHCIALHTPSTCSCFLGGRTPACQGQPSSNQLYFIIVFTWALCTLLHLDTSTIVLLTPVLFLLACLFQRIGLLDFSFLLELLVNTQMFHCSGLPLHLAHLYRKSYWSTGFYEALNFLYFWFQVLYSGVLQKCCIFREPSIFDERSWSICQFPQHARH